MSEWKKLEEYVAFLTRADHTKLTPLSGATKREEDVVGTALICQCKQTEDKNASILEKDVTRLLEASKLLDKFPLFFVSSKMGRFMVVPINDDTEVTVEDMIDTAALGKRLTDLYLTYKHISEYRSLVKANKELDLLEKMAEELASQNKRLIQRIRTQLKVKEDNITMYNLFDGQKDEPKKI